MIKVKSHLYQRSFVPKWKIGAICTKMKNRCHLYQNYSTRFLIGRIVSQRIITLIYYCSNRRKLNSRVVTAAVASTSCGACEQRVGLYTKIRATVKQELKVVGLIVLVQLNIFGTNASDFLFWFKWDWFIILVLVNTHRDQGTSDCNLGCYDIFIVEMKMWIEHQI